MTPEIDWTSDADGFTDILVPTDGSECATAGVRHGIRLARGFDATVHFLYVVDRTTGRLPIGLPLSGESTDELQQAGEKTLEESAALAHDAGVEVTTELMEGTPHERIQDYVTANYIDLVAMGTHGRTEIERHLLGSVTGKVVRTVSVPVLTVRSQASDESLDAGYTDILLPTRGGEGAELAARRAIAVAARFDATLHVLYVADIRSQATQHDTYEIESLVEKLHEEVTDEVVARAADAGVTATAVVQQGTPHSAIQRYTEEHDIDLVVMGTHGRGQVERFLLGSITERTIRTADPPVITVRLDEWFTADGMGTN